MDRFTDISKNLTILEEECAEVVQSVCKIRRFGMGDFDPRNSITNDVTLATEIGHVLCMIDILLHHNTVDVAIVEEARKNKIDKLAKYYHRGEPLESHR
jgi:NTP pyrophosphatase (non-canonical NTP hydrolase)